MRHIVPFAICILSAAMFLHLEESTSRPAVPRPHVERGEREFPPLDFPEVEPKLESEAALAAESPSLQVDGPRLLTKREALIRMLECLRAADSSFSWTPEHLEQFEESMSFREEKYREVWWNIIGASSITLDAESGTVLELSVSASPEESLPPIGSEARRRRLAEAGVTNVLAELKAREFTWAAYPEFHTRPFQWEGTTSKSYTHGSDSWTVRFREHHGADASKYRNWIAVEVDAFTAKVTDSRATYVRADTDPILYGPDAAKRISMGKWASAQDEPAPLGDFNRITVDLHVWPVSRNRARAIWEVESWEQVEEGGEMRIRSHYAHVDAATGEVDSDDIAWEMLAEQSVMQRFGF